MAPAAVRCGTFQRSIDSAVCWRRMRWRSRKSTSKRRGISARAPSSFRLLKFTPRPSVASRQSTQQPGSTALGDKLQILAVLAPRNARVLEKVVDKMVERLQNPDTAAP
jgi:hypothetical protein